MAKSDLIAMNEMADKNSPGIRMSPYFVEAKLAKGGGHVTMGVDAQVIHDLAFQEKYVVALYIIDKEEFDKIKGT